MLINNFSKYISNKNKFHIAIYIKEIYPQIIVIYHFIYTN